VPIAPVEDEQVCAEHWPLVQIWPGWHMTLPHAFEAAVVIDGTHVPVELQTKPFGQVEPMALFCEHD